MIISIEEARAYARDNESTNEEMEAFILAAESYIEDGVAPPDPENPKMKLLAKLLVCEFDENRGISGGAKEANARSRLIDSMILQLKTGVKPVSNLDTGTGGEGGNC